ncbi:MAG: HlyD family efflux transporter periplasmic adaptor subunit [Acidobacteria bacterium]|jgi:multidrug resistance efflux pump|nr:HlyD family efflux transporter periplasmic adaptor subunit [Acidobacteriota bacterium]
MKKKIAIIAAVLVIGGISTAFTLRRQGPDPLAVSGTLEARNISVGSKVGGRVSSVQVREGDHVQPNQLLITFDSAELQGQRLQAQGRVEAARANLEKMLRGSRPEEIAEAVAASHGFREAELAQAQADLERVRTEDANARRELARMEQLAAARVVSQRELDNAQDRARAAQAQVNASTQAVAAAEGRLMAAKAVAEKTQHGFRREDVAAARAELTLAEGQLQETEARWAEREVRAPAPAVVETLDLRPGDLLPANSPVAQLLEADQLYLMVYVPETQIGAVRVGQSAKIRVDTYPGQTFLARVEQIRQQSEFLPRNVQTREERVHQMIGVRLRVENSDNRLRAGVSADVEFTPEAR